MGGMRVGMGGMGGRRLWCERGVRGTFVTVRCMRVKEKGVCDWVWEMMDIGCRAAVLSCGRYGDISIVFSHSSSGINEYSRSIVAL